MALGSLAGGDFTQYQLWEHSGVLRLSDAALASGLGASFRRRDSWRISKGSKGRAPCLSSGSYMSAFAPEAREALAER